MQHNKMAAPCRGMVCRRLRQLMHVFWRTATENVAFRPLSSTSSCQSTSHTQSVKQRTGSPWSLMAAVCLQRLPVISAELNDVEERFNRLMRQMELEKSTLSDHELRVLQDAERVSREQSGNYGDEDDNREIILAQDLEDSWDQKLKDFHPAPRTRADVDEDRTSVERCLADSLVLVAEQQLGPGKLWLLPQAQWQEGETLRQTAERALASISDADFKATFLGSAPCGVYKYKLPQAVRTESSAGVKVFFFKAIVSDGGPSAAPNAASLWLKKSELEHYLKPEYLKKVKPFIISV
ncbi:39S ribosomal protein L46, mitochondrial [Thalassophryne amazonica]|uniref:39S ribosomal protein L46, mitochondrial n=1 Tax=Thalassophryne amazonica TaxID=390379 RepID=UPI00147213FD|nr:39S ribosomal protein L46, mitochondrial [Thalassophryne amazonica]